MHLSSAPGFCIAAPPKPRLQISVSATNPGQINTKSSRLDPNYRRGNSQRLSPAERRAKSKDGSSVSEKQEKTKTVVSPAEKRAKMKESRMNGGSTTAEKRARSKDGSSISEKQGKEKAPLSPAERRAKANGTTSAKQAGVNGGPSAAEKQKKGKIKPKLGQGEANAKGRTIAPEEPPQIKEGLAAAGPIGVKKKIRDVPDVEFDFGVSAAQGPRETMEDEAVVFESGKCGYMYAMVLDGHDGLLSVQWLADRLFDIFSSVTDGGMYSGTCDLDAADPQTGLCCPINLSPVLTEMFEAADVELLQHLKEQGGITAARSGSTATVALVKKDRLVVANVGDSRLVLCRSGRALDITTEHRLYGKGPTVQGEIQRVMSTGAWVDDGRVCGLLAVSRAFGDWELKEEGLEHFLEESVELGFVSKDFADKVKFTGSPVVATPDVTELLLRENDDFLIMASDGIWDVLSSADAVRMVRRKFNQGGSAQEASDFVCELALKRYTTDNVACVVIDLLGKDARISRSTRL